MFELGDYTEKLHREVGKEVVNNKIDILICCGEFSKYIIKQAEEDGMEKKNMYYISNKEDIINLLKKEVKEGDVLLFKASNGMKFFDLATQFEKYI